MSQSGTFAIWHLEFAFFLVYLFKYLSDIIAKDFNAIQFFLQRFFWSAIFHETVEKALERDH